MRHAPDIPSLSESADGRTDASPAASGRVLVILPDLDGRRRARDDKGGRTPETRQAEAVGLVEAIGLDVAEACHVAIRSPNPATLFGSGKVEELAALVRVHDVDLVVVDHALTPVQQRNLEKAWKAKVLDRTGLILEIFGARARTKEGRLQVELAHLQYQKSRLVRSWTHLERQRGGFGFVGGPGETQIETDRRLIEGRIRQIEDALAKVHNMRNVHRAKRKGVPQPVAAIVGYTNAGKSTLFNRLTGASVLAENMPFVTLDPTLRRVALPHGEAVILSDTVGFISDLPTTLVAAFRATLEEVIEADVILHVRDLSSPEWQAQADDVLGVLGELGISPSDRRIVEIWNKVDRLEPHEREIAKARARSSEPPAVVLSALSGEGMDDLLGMLEDRLMEDRPTMVVSLSAGQLGATPWLYENAEILERRDDPQTGDARLTVRLPEKRLGALHDWARDSGAVVAAGTTDPA